MQWFESTSPELDKCSRDLPVILPLGSCEQHGRHLPVGTDSLQLQAICRELEKSLGDRALIAPVLWLGSSHHHLDFPGALSVLPQLYSQIIKSLATCYLRHGFYRLFFLNGHGGNIVPASQALTELVCEDDTADAANMALASWFTMSAKKLSDERHGMTTERVTHACEYETSLILATRPDLVKMSELSADHVEITRPYVDPRWGGRLEGFHRFHRWTSTGHMGQPSEASAAKGKSMLADVAEAITEFIVDFSTWPRMEIQTPKRPDR